MSGLASPISRAVYTRIFALGIASLSVSGLAFSGGTGADTGEMLTGVRPVDFDFYLPVDLDTGFTSFSTESQLKIKELHQHGDFYVSEPVVVTMHPAIAEDGTIGKLGITPAIREENIFSTLQTTFPKHTVAFERPQLRISPDPIADFGPRVSVATVTGKAERPYTITKILYATDRGSFASTDLRTFFDDTGVERGSLSYGLATLRIDERLEPPDHGWFAWVTRFFRSDPRPPVAETMTNAKFSDYRELSAGIRKALDETRQDELLIYVHGYRTSFDDDIRSGVVLGYLTKFRGPVLAYSWPSRGALADYDADYESADRTIPRLTQLLEDLSKIPGLRKIHVIAHSMGTRVVFWALQRSALHLGQVIMVAGDASRDDFEQYFNSMRNNADRFTLYSTKTDLALYTSSQLHRGERVGFWSGKDGPFQLAGLDSIDATPAVTDLLSHGYYLNSELPRTDIIYVLQAKTAEERGCVRWHDANQRDYLIYSCP